MLDDHSPSVPVWFADLIALWNPEVRTAVAEHSWEGIYSDIDIVTRLLIDKAQALHLDAITPFTHPLAAAALLGSKLRFGDDGAPALIEHLHSPAQIRSLHLHPTSLLHHDLTMVKACQELSDGRTMIARHVGPFTLTGHLIEGQASWQPRFRALMFQYPTEARTLLSRSTEAIVAWARAMKCIGVEYIFIEEPWAELIGPEDQLVFITPWLEQIVKQVPELNIILRVPGMDGEIGRFKKAGVWAWFPGLHTSVEQLREQSHWSLPVVGPFEVGRLLSAVPVIHQSVGRFIELYGARDFIVSLSSVPLPHTDIRSLHAFVEAVKSFEVKA
jgi:uroporphyrinogen-III decarboxylase